VANGADLGYRRRGGAIGGINEGTC